MLSLRGYNGSVNTVVPLYHRPVERIKIIEYNFQQLAAAAAAQMAFEQQSAAAMQALQHQLLRGGTHIWGF